MATTPRPTGTADAVSGAPAGTDVRTGERPLSRQVDYYWTLYRRTWRSSVVFSFLAPLLYVVAMGVILGGYIDAGAGRLEGADSYLQFVVPGLAAAHAMQTAAAESMFPIYSKLKWTKTYWAQQATPLRPRDMAAGSLAFIGARLVTTAGVFVLVMAPFGIFATWWGALGTGTVALLVGLVCASWLYGVSVRTRTEQIFGVVFRIGIFPMFLFSGAFFPVANLGEVLGTLAKVTPLWHGVHLSRMLALDRVEPGWALLNLAVLLALLVGGWAWAVTGIRRRMEG